MIAERFKKPIAAIAAISFAATIAAPPASALDVPGVVTSLQATDSSLPSGVANPKGNIGWLLWNIFWKSSDAGYDSTKLGKIRPQYVDGAGAWTQSAGKTFLTDSGSNVGIGTSNPSAKLDVVGAIWKDAGYDAWGMRNGVMLGTISEYGNSGPFNLTGASLGMTVSNTSDGAFFGVVSRGANYNDYNAVIGWGDDPGDDLQFRFANNVYASLTSAGNFGIGTSAPTAKLEVAGGVAKISGSPDNILSLKTTDDTWLYTEWYNSANVRKFWMGLDQSLSWFSLVPENGVSGVSVSNTLYATSGGKVGVGISAPTAKFEVAGNILSKLSTDSYNSLGVGNSNGVWNLYSLTSGDATPNGFLIEQCPAGNSCSRRLSIDQSGNVGIGTSVPAAKLDVAGSLNVSGTIKGAAEASVYVDVNAADDSGNGLSASSPKKTLGAAIAVANALTADKIRIWIANSSSSNRAVMGSAQPLTGKQVQITASSQAVCYIDWNASLTVSDVGLRFGLLGWERGCDIVLNTGIMFYTEHGAFDLALNNGATTITFNANGQSLFYERYLNNVIGSVRIYTDQWNPGASAVRPAAGVTGTKIIQDNYSGQNVYVEGASNFIDAAVDQTGVYYARNIKSASNGNVGIGSSATPGEKLELNGKLMFSMQNTDWAKIFFESASDAAYQSNMVFETFDNGDEGFKFRTTGTDRVFIRGDGNVGIGTTSPTRKLHVVGDIQQDGDVYGGLYGGTRGIWRFSSADANFGIFYTESSPDYISISANGGYNTNPNMVIRGDSRVGIGTASPRSTLDVNGDISMPYVRLSAYRYSSSGNASGWLHLKTNQGMNSVMQTLHFMGYEYGATKTLNAQVSYYPYGVSNTIYNMNASGTHPINVYKSSDGYCVVAIQFTSEYFLGFVMDQYGPGPQGIFPISILGTAWSASSSGVY